MTVLGWSVFFYVNVIYYANVMELSFFIPTLAVQLYIGIEAVIRRKKVLLYAGFLIMILAAIYFFVMVPDCTYKEAQQSIMEEYQTEEVELISLDHRTVPADHSSWFMPDKMYYVAVAEKGKNDQIDYYSVDAVQGRVVKLEEAYW